jgi:hypothetical protein
VPTPHLTARCFCNATIQKSSTNEDTRRHANE